MNILITIIFGILGFVFSLIFLKPENINWYIPEKVKYIQNFINVGSIHNFGYIGGLVGLIIGIYKQIKSANKNDA